MTWQVSLRGRPVHNPVARLAVSLVVVLAAVVWMCVVAAVLIVSIPVALVIHPILRLTGRRGALRRGWEGDKRTFELSLDREAFRRDAR